MITQADAAAYHSTKYDLRNRTVNTDYESGNRKCCRKCQETLIFLFMVILGGFTFKLFIDIRLLEMRIEDLESTTTNLSRRLTMLDWNESTKVEILQVKQMVETRMSNIDKQVNMSVEDLSKTLGTHNAMIQTMEESVQSLNKGIEGFADRISRLEKTWQNQINQQNNHTNSQTSTVPTSSVFNSDQIPINSLGEGSTPKDDNTSSTPEIG